MVSRFASPMDILTAALMGLVLFLPALIPNSAAALFGGGTPVDFNRTWRGKRLLGDGKTWRGLFGGIGSGIFIGLLMLAIAYLAGSDDGLGYGQFPQNVGVIACLAIGSLLGDMAGAFIKRRLGMARGQKAPGLDQYDFVAGAFLLTYLAYPSWVISTYLEGEAIVGLVVLLIFVPVLHRLVNIIGFKMGTKKEPW
ncbi:MAG TPA: CDP-2,3-bis-(O-geranylgeranyl)-sn-glycerol synthase [Methanomassiliicoccaceae archaeon]|nr:CDP-2,3-bis-(O-geranylgeranyl)-sn-glycerol synthase [Methanomassiliicoccaceae archaeon]